MNYLEFYEDVNESLVNKKKYDDRAKSIESYIEKLISASPGKDRGEKLQYVWKTYPVMMDKLLKGNEIFSKSSIFGRIGQETKQSSASKYLAIRYYIRFGDVPKIGKSKNWDANTMEPGISAYHVIWNNIQDKWEIVESDLSELAALHSFTGDFINGEGNERPVYLIQGIPLIDLGSDGEAMLDINNIKIIKRLEPYEFFSKDLGVDWYVNGY